MEYMSARFAELFDLGQSTDVDEQAIPCKCRHRCRCYNPNKPAKFHFKMYCLNDSTTGYMFKFFLYQGKDECRPAGQSATMYPVCRLTTDAGMDQKGHIVFGDNWYTLLPLIKQLRGSGIHYVGTVKSNVKGLPKDSIFRKGNKRSGAVQAAGAPRPSKKARGGMAQMETTTLGDPIYFRRY